MTNDPGVLMSILEVLVACAYSIYITHIQFGELDDCLNDQWFENVFRWYKIIHITLVLNVRILAILRHTYL